MVVHHLGGGGGRDVLVRGDAVGWQDWQAAGVCCCVLILQLQQLLLLLLRAVPAAACARGGSGDAGHRAGGTRSYAPAHSPYCAGLPRQLHKHVPPSPLLLLLLLLLQLPSQPAKPLPLPTSPLSVCLFPSLYRAALMSRPHSSGGWSRLL